MKKIYLAFECFVLFVLIPTIMYTERLLIKSYIIPFIILFSLVCFVYLWRDKSFDRTLLSWGSHPVLHIRQIGRNVLIAGAVIVLVIWLVRPELLFNFVRRSPVMWLMVMILYPIVSVYPQEIIFRAFFFHRYRTLFPSSLLQIIISGVLFGYAHIFFANWIAPLLTTIGGIMFARRYAHSKSVLIASFDHAIWGDFIFTCGLGMYFYGGAISA